MAASFSDPERLDMSTNKGGTASGSRKAAVSAKDSRVKNDEVLEDLATELYGAVGMALRKSGVNKRAQSRAIAGSGMATKMPTASGAVLRNSQSCLLYTSS